MAYVVPTLAVTGTIWTAANMNDYRNDLAILSTALLIPHHQSGGYYGQIGTYVAGAVVAPTLQRLYADLFVAPATGSYNQIAIQMSAGSGNGRLGIYNDNNGVPGSLLLDAGTLALSGTGVKTSTINQSLTGPAKYWLAAIFDNVSLNLTAQVGIGLLGFASNSISYGVQGLSANGVTFGALPDPFPASSPAAADAPMIVVRKA